MPTYQRPNERLGAEGGVAAGRMQSLGVKFGSVDWSRGHAQFFSEWTPTAGLSPCQHLLSPRLSRGLSPWQHLLSPRLSRGLSPCQHLLPAGLSPRQHPLTAVSAPVRAAAAGSASEPQACSRVRCERRGARQRPAGQLKTAARLSPRQPTWQQGCRHGCRPVSTADRLADLEAAAATARRAVAAAAAC